MSQKVIVYSTQYCPFCNMAKNLLSNKGIEFEEIDLTQDDAKRQEIASKTGWQTVPMIFIGEEFVGGFNELHDLDQSGELDNKVNVS